MARCLLLALTGLAALALSSAAAAKGPTVARIEGPGLASPLVLRGFGEDGNGPLGALTADGGFFATTFGEEPDRRLPSRPAGDLGPRYAIDYTVPAGVTEATHLQQDVYPYAPGGPVLHVAPGQEMFEGGGATVGGWVRAPESLLAVLVAAGLPATAPGTGSRVAFLEPALLGALGVALLALCGGALALRRRRLRARAARSPRSGAASA